VSNKGEDGGPGRTIEDGGKGYACIAELRSVETILEGAPQTPFLKAGDRVEIEMRDETGASIFGSIRQTVATFAPAALEAAQ
jgi:fumarylacetoacetate (FAA) hydrolase